MILKAANRGYSLIQVCVTEGIDLLEEVYYAKKDIADHFEFNKIKEFSLK